MELYPLKKHTTRQGVLTNHLEDIFLCADSLTEFGNIPNKNMMPEARSKAHQEGWESDCRMK